MPPNSSTVRCTRTPRSSTLPLCVGTPMAAPPSPRRCSTARSQASGLRLATATFAPASTNPSASARPMPLVPPVTMTVRPAMSKRRSNDVRSTRSVEQIGIRGHPLLNALGRLSGDPLDVVGRAVVAVIAMQLRHSGDVLLDVLRQADRGQHLPLPFVVGDVFA